MNAVVHAVAAGVLALALTSPRASHAEGLEEPRAIYARGRAAYDRGDYAEALEQFTRAYELRPAPALLFNMAQASRLAGKGHCAEALRLYERYLEKEPSPENRAEVDERIVQMRSCADEEARAAAPVSTSEPVAASTPQPAMPPPAPRSAAPPPASATEGERRTRGGTTPLGAVLATGLGASLAVAGGVLYLRARSKFDEVEERCPCPDGSYSSWETLTTVSYAMMATGLVVSGTGATVWVLSGAAGSPDQRVNGGGLRFSGRF